MAGIEVAQNEKHRVRVLNLNVNNQLRQGALRLPCINFGWDRHTCKYNRGELSGGVEGFAVYGHKLQQGAAVLVYYWNIGAPINVATQT